MARKKKKFSGPLAEPMRPMIEGIIARVQNDPDNSFDAKFKFLLDHYGLAKGPNQYLYLSMALAMEIVPAFQLEKKRGAKTKWTDDCKACLVVEIERSIEQADRDQSITWAAKELSKKEPWKSLVQSNDSSEMLRQVYSKSKNKEFAGKMRLVFWLCKYIDNLDMWNKVVVANVNILSPN